MHRKELMRRKTALLRIIVGFTGIVVAVVLISASTAVSQTAVSYRFLQVIDSTGSPIPGAQGQTSGDGVGKSVLSDVLGKLKLQIWYGDFNTRGFSVSKEGYYSYEDLGLINGIFSDSIYGNGTEGSQRLVLLKIPKQLRLDDPDYLEQRKREFFFAAKKGDTASLRQLLKEGLDPNMSTAQLRGIPFSPDVPMIAFAAMSGNAATVAAVLDAGANLGPKGGYGATALVYYLRADFPMAAPNATATQIADTKRMYEDGALQLIERGADVAATGHYGATTLMLAAAKGMNRTAETLIKKGVPVDDRDGSGSTALIYAIDSRQLDVVRLLLKYITDRNMLKDALRRAEQRQAIPIIEMLRAAGARDSDTP